MNPASKIRWNAFPFSTACRAGCSNCGPKATGRKRPKRLARAVSVVPSPCVRVNAARDEWEALRDFLCKEGEAVGISGVRFAPGTQPEYMRDYLRQGRLSIQGAGSQLVLEALDAPRGKAPMLGRLRRTRRQDARAR